MLTLDLVAEEDAASQDCGASWDEDLQVELQTEVLRSRQRADTDVSKLRVSSREPKVKTGSLPRGSERSWGRNLEVHKKHQVQVGQTLLGPPAGPEPLRPAPVLTALPGSPGPVQNPSAREEVPPPRPQPLRLHG